MEMLTMGPMPCKMKKEQWPDEFGSRTEFNTYRCGVSSCPEVLARARWDVSEWSFIVGGDYRKNGSGIYLRTRRALIRDEGQRRFLDEGPKVLLRERAERVAFMDAASPEQKTAFLMLLVERGYGKDFIEETKELLYNSEKRLQCLQEEIDEVKKAKQARTNQTGDVMGIENLPIVFKCGRCGRFSKIEGAG
jgi:hypothetical protein